MRLLLPILLLGLTVSGGAQAVDLLLGSDRWPPFTDEAGRRAVAVSLVHEALKRGGFEAQTRISGFGEVLAAIQEGSLDGSAALWHAPDREAYLLFSEPYLENRLILVGRKGSDVSAASLDELAGKRVAVVENYAYGAEVESAGEVVFVNGSDDQANLELLLDGKVDYILVDGLLINYLLQYQAEEASQYLALGSNPLARRTLHFAVRKDLRGAEYIVERFNRQIGAMVADGTFNQILQLNWIRSDIDGDGREELVLGGDRAGVSPPSSNYDLLLDSTASGPYSLRYYIDGQVYETWEDVPARYKVPDVTEEDLNRPGLRLLEFKF